jgi:hypothetical protein
VTALIQQKKAPLKTTEKEQKNNFIYMVGGRGCSFYVGLIQLKKNHR